MIDIHHTNATHAKRWAEAKKRAAAKAAKKSGTDRQFDVLPARSRSDRRASVWKG